MNEILTKDDLKHPQELWEFFYKFDDKKPILFIMIGLPGSGKSYFADRLLVGQNKYTNEYATGILIRKPEIISSDSLRKELYGDENTQDHNSEIFQELHRRIKRSLISGRDVIYDATNISKKRRIQFIKELKSIDCWKVAVPVMTPIHKCMEQNSNRERIVPKEVIINMWKSWCPPHRSEGFDDILLYYNIYLHELKEYTTVDLFYNEQKGLINLDQNNHHHKLTIGYHCIKTFQNMANFISNNRNVYDYPDTLILAYAALFHDIGKAYTKSYKNAKGEITEDAHYFNHQNVSAYHSLFYLYGVISFSDNIFEISNFIYYHMMPFAWEKNNGLKEKYISLLGKQMVDYIEILHKADMEACE